MNDKELLRLAAKAAGCQYKYHNDDKCASISLNGELVRYNWNPIDDDADALRLAVRLEISCWKDNDLIWCNGIASVVGEDAYQDMRRAIVRAAAEIGKSL